MHRRHLLACFCAPALVPLSAQSVSSTALSQLDRDIPLWMADKHIPGLAIAAVEDGQPAWTRTYGVAEASSGRQVTAVTRFEAASLSKPVFAHAVLQLVDQGVLALDRPLISYLPEPPESADDPRLARVTARHVLSHTTGFRNWPGFMERPLRVHFAPGERFSYSGQGFVFLARVIAQLTGEPLEATARRLVFEPLGMQASSYVPRDQDAGLRASAHNAAGLPTRANTWPATGNAAASLMTTAGDYARFLAAVLRGEGLRPETAALMLQPQTRVGASPFDLGTVAGATQAQLAWTLGWGWQQVDGEAWIWHWGDNGDTKAFALGSPRQRRGVVYFGNSVNGLAIAHRLLGPLTTVDQPALDWLRYGR